MIYPYLRGGLYHHLRRAVIREGEMEYLVRAHHVAGRHAARLHRSNPIAACIVWGILIMLAVAYL